MTTQTVPAAQANNNPGARPEHKSDAGSRRRIPMSTPTRRLEVPELPGYVLYWFSNANVPRAMQAGYEFVDSQELPLNQHNVATNKDVSGNTDLGSHVSIISGMDAQGQPEHLTLMKIKQEWYDEDQQVLKDRNASVLSGIFQEEKILGTEQQSGEDKRLSYVKTAKLERDEAVQRVRAQKPLLNRTPRKAT